MGRAHMWGARIRALTALTAAVALCACAASSQGDGETYSDGSRSELYDSVSALAADSSTVIRGTVAAQETSADPGGAEADNTFSTIRVEQVFGPAELGAEVAEQVAAPQAGETVGVVQYGTSADEGTIAPILKPGTEYVLFLTPSEMKPPNDDAAGVYWITGQVAGLYVLSPDRTSIERVVADSGDNLTPQSEISVLWSDREEAPATMPS